MAIYSWFYLFHFFLSLLKLCFIDLDDKEEQLQKIKELIQELPPINQKVLGALVSIMGKLSINSHIHKVFNSNFKIKSNCMHRWMFQIWLQF